MKSLHWSHVVALSLLLALSACSEDISSKSDDTELDDGGGDSRGGRGVAASVMRSTVFSQASPDTSWESSSTQKKSSCKTSKA